MKVLINSILILLFLGCSKKLSEGDAIKIASDYYNNGDFILCINFIEDYMNNAHLDSSKTYYMYSLKINSAYNINDYKKCIFFVEEMQVKYPHKAALYAKKAECYENLKEYDSAINNYSTALNFEKNNTKYLNNRGLIFFAKGKLVEAMKDFDSAILLDSSMHSAYNGKGIVYEKKKQYDSALIYYSKAISLQKNYVYLCNRGILYLRMKLPTEGIRDFTESIILNEHYSLAITNKGYGFEMLNNYDSACFYWKRAIEKGDNEALGRYNNNCN